MMMNVRAVYRTAFLPWLLLLIVKGHVTVSGQGVTVDLGGLPLPNNSLVNFDDIPSFATDRGVTDDSVLNCRTDLEACCNANQDNVPTPVGEWYYPNGTALDFDDTTFRRNRGSMIVRLWRRNTPTERGRFHCEVPNAQNVNQTVYVNILNIGPVTIAASGGSNTRIAGTSFSLVCSATVQTQPDTATPNFDWFFGPNNVSLPSGATPMATVMGNTYTSTLQFSPLQESHAGMYTCRLGSNARLTVKATIVLLNNGFVLNGAIYPNGSTVLRTDIGEGDAALNCTTDSTTCCRSGDGETRAGQFYFPNGSMVLNSIAAPSNSYYRSRSSRLISLHRRSAATQTGEFRCEIPDANGTLVNLFINIVDISLSITSSGTNTAGETYSLECSATVTGSTDQPIITWLDPMNNPFPSEMVTITGSMSTLTFNPLAASHAGTYTCRVTAGDVTETQTSTVIVNVITAQVNRSGSGPLIAGQTGFSLSCDVTGTENLNTPTFTYQWRRNGRVISAQQGSTLSLSPLTALNAGEYDCSVSVSSTSLSSTVTVNSNTDNLTLLTLQSNVSLTFNTSNPILSGSNVTLTCTVELSPAVDVPVTVNTVWTGPSTKSVTASNRVTIEESLTLYMSELVLKSVESADSGQYNCAIEVVSGVEVTASINVEIVDGLFQLRLKGVDICTQWYITKSSKEAIKYINYIDMALVEAIERHTKRHFPVDNLLEGSFSCEESPDLMTYRSAVVGTHNFNGSRIIGFIQDWVSSGPRIKIDRSHVRVDSSCPVALTSLDEPECGLKEVCLTSGDDPHSFTVCAKKLDNRNVATCFQDCITNN